MSEPIPIHIGLMGHIDHGKTELARALSEKVSTAGLDKHPQSKERGITIDLGFTMFRLNEYIVTLVDAPGHADLIRSVVAGANIIDAAILVVAADEGPKIQTGEHIIVLSSLGIDTVVVAITKCDLVGEERLAQIEAKVQSIMSSSGLLNYEIVRVSARTGYGIDSLHAALYRLVKPKERDRDGPFLLPIDHAFPKKGHGTVVTGTILRGRIAVDDMVAVVPLGTSVRARSIQVFSEERQKASAGDRVGINVPDLDSRNITRGDYLCQGASLAVSDCALCTLTLNSLYKGRITKKMVLSATVGMPSITSEIIPYDMEAGKLVVLDGTENTTITAALLFQRKIGVEVGMNVLLMRTDLPPTAVRIIGSGAISAVPSSISLLKKRIRKGRVTRLRDDDVLVDGLASRKEIAEKLVGKSITSSSGISGKVLGTFGTRGVVMARFDTPVAAEEEITFTTLVEEEYHFGH